MNEATICPHINQQTKGPGIHWCSDCGKNEPDSCIGTAQQKPVVHQGMPDWAKAVKIGDWLTIKQEFGLTRGGEVGQVVDGPNDEGVSLDFYCDRDGNEDEVPSIEFWEWDEIDPVA
ncbi:hypothetical protein [Pseudomonas syringae]|uniref:hypothetical protein n=1 Tax=Pseudomonas syringae TaxID=317 RepID=UPI001F25CCDC|nr:hypothetical protein [Pseudomonas syringae]MCF5371983.1 hypothetical protein [Pseudomonas syringae]MCF5382020.1 hypothetical protein [Pseudomonas syringae]MCF5419447.1 hypothetical protein [Pseudomonas syringae]MCF5451993.1 hypothetical protein [Pseudomonas syringae]MCF5456280.1 hypothetical protein [Pseudomonas syringae]